MTHATHELTHDLYDTDASFSAIGDADADDFLNVDEDISSLESDVTDLEDFSDDDFNVTDQVYLCRECSSARILPEGATRVQQECF
ncbi:Uu.00g098820.m01.CDS01 [Anthostomella pinea]|uniref:Uu.00g098820.m01.CDS01 n=1 Tax=Anthostomella pinea TaxID=933095 RepID=A0AAI8YFA7_9PEZI|nr:Uu.00g098820.m01.CDS01 [Anthostomella pinea]